MVPQGWIHRQVGEVLSDGLGHVGQHPDHDVGGELAWRDVRWTIAGGGRDPVKTCMFLLILIRSLISKR